LRTRLWHKTRLGKFRTERKGFSSIVGAIFMVIIVWILASGYFIYTLSENTVYNDAIREKNLLEVDRLSESVQVSNTTYSVNSNNNVVVTAQIQNTGPSSIQFLTIWIYASNSTGWNNHNFSKLNATFYTVPGGSTFSLNVPLTVNGLYSTSAYNITSWLITTRGNTVPLPKQPAVTNNITVAQISQGIGSIAMDMKQFTHYDLNSSPNNGTDIGAPNHSFIVPKSKYTFFALLLTNCDPSGQDINLTSNCYIWVPTAQSETMKSDSWSIAKIVGNNYMTGFTYQILPWSIPTWVYFGATQPKWDAGVLPVNICLFGKIGSADYGQNIPFISVDFQ
jgi:hypothetical protein